MRVDFSFFDVLVNLLPTWSRSLGVISAVLLALAGNASARPSSVLRPFSVAHAAAHQLRAVPPVLRTWHSAGSDAFAQAPRALLRGLCRAP